MLSFYAVVSNKAKSSFQKVLRKIISLSETIDLGKPWYLTTLSRTALATHFVVKGCFKGKMSIFGIPINHHQDRVISFRKRKSFNKVHSPILPSSLWNGKWLCKSAG
jgi:hypothetical protein